MMDISVVGCGGFGREIMELLLEENLRNRQYNIKGFYDDNRSLIGKEINGYPVIGCVEDLISIREKIAVMVCVGEPATRKKIIEKLIQNNNIVFPNLIAESVIYNKRLTELGVGNIIYSNCVLTTNVSIGDFNYINSSCTLSHDVKISNYVTLAPSCTLTGNVSIADNVYIGAGTMVREGVNIGRDTIVGMGSVIVSEIPHDVIAYGNPCRVIRQKNKDERIF